MKNKNRITITSVSLTALLAIAACGGSQLKAELPPEAADPEARDLSVWKDIKPGLHSGFGSVDVAYSKSIPPARRSAADLSSTGR